MTEADAIPAAAAARDAVKAYLRIESDAEDAQIDTLIAAAIGHGEAFTGRLLLIRAVRETVPAAAAWRRLTCTPVRGVSTVEGVPATGDPFALAIGGYAIDIDAAGDGWVRVSDAGAAARVRLTYMAGLSADWAGLPEPLRQGVVRLASHFFTHRDAADEGAPPAAVAALWRPWRRMRLA